MSYEIELTIGDRTHHYGSLATYRKDIDARLIRIKRLWANAHRDGQTSQRRAELIEMANTERRTLADIHSAMQEQTRKAYNDCP